MFGEIKINKLVFNSIKICCRKIDSDTSEKEMSEFLDLIARVIQNRDKIIYKSNEIIFDWECGEDDCIKLKEYHMKKDTDRED